MENYNNIAALIDEIREENEIERKYLKKQLNIMRILMIAMAGVFLMLLAAVIILVPKAMSTLDNANVALEQVVYTAGQADEVLESAGTLIEDSSEGVTAALEKINNIDFEGLNQSINDLRNVVSPLGDFFSKFR